MEKEEKFNLPPEITTEKETGELAPEENSKTNPKEENPAQKIQAEKEAMENLSRQYSGKEYGRIRPLAFRILQKEGHPFGYTFYFAFETKDQGTQAIYLEKRGDNYSVGGDILEKEINAANFSQAREELEKVIQKIPSLS